jgi:hypothetical protein
MVFSGVNGGDLMKEFLASVISSKHYPNQVFIMLRWAKQTEKDLLHSSTCFGTMQRVCGRAGGGQKTSTRAIILCLVRWRNGCHRQ